MNKLLMLAAGYVAGSGVSSLFSKDRWDKLRKKMETAKKKWEDTHTVILDHFIETQKSALDSLKSQALTDKNVSQFNKKKKELLKVVDDYKKEGQKMLKDLDKNGEEYIAEAQEKLEKLYQEKTTQIKDIKWEDVKAVGKKLLASFEAFKKKINK